MPKQHKAIHTGANDLSNNATPTDIATNIINLATDVKDNFNQLREIIVPSIVASGGQSNQKATKVNKELKVLCFSENIRCIDPTNIHPRKYLNRSKLHFI